MDEESDLSLEIPTVFEVEEQEVFGNFSLSQFFDHNFSENAEGDDKIVVLEDEMVEEVMSTGNDANSSEIKPKSWEENLKDPEFQLKDKAELKDFIESAKNVNTLKKTTQVVKMFQKWLKENCGEERPIETIEPTELDGLLANYLLNKTKANGEPHQPDPLTLIHRAVVRHLRANDYEVDSMFHETFEVSRNVLASKRSKLKADGLGNRPNRAERFDEEEMEKLWEKGALGFQDPCTIQSTLYWFQALGYGLRGCDESHAMKWGDVDLVEGKEELSYLQFNERATKTRKGGDGGHMRAFAPKIYATNDDHCPVKCYKLFASKRPDSMMFPAAPFYLTVKKRQYIV